MTDVFINNIAAFLPNAPVSNDEMETVLGQVGPRPSRARRIILRNNRIQSRYYAIDPVTRKASHSNAELCAEAIRRLTAGGVALSDIESMACATSMPDQLMPAHGSMVHGALASPPCEVVTTAGVCVSGVSAMKYAYAMVRSGLHNTAVAAASEAASSMLRAEHFTGVDGSDDERISELEQHPEIAFERDFLRWMLSDGAGAMLLSGSPNRDSISLRLDWIDILSFANEMSACMYAGAIKNDNGRLIGWRDVDNSDRQTALCVSQDVKQLNEHIIPYSVEKTLGQIARLRGLKADDYDFFLPHFSSGFFESRVAEGLDNIGFSIPKEKWFTNLFTKGNIGSASMYVILEELFHSGRLQRGNKLLCFIPESGRFSSAFIQLTVV